MLVYWPVASCLAILIWPFTTTSNAIRSVCIRRRQSAKPTLKWPCNSCLHLLHSSTGWYLGSLAVSCWPASIVLMRRLQVWFKTACWGCRCTDRSGADSRIKLSKPLLAAPKGFTGLKAHKLASLHGEYFCTPSPSPARPPSFCLCAVSACYSQWLQHSGSC